MMIFVFKAMEQNTRSINTHGYRHAGTVSRHKEWDEQVVSVASLYSRFLSFQILKGWRTALTRMRAAGTVTALTGTSLQEDASKAAPVRRGTAPSPTGSLQWESPGKGRIPLTATEKTTETTTDQTAGTETETDRTGEGWEMLPPGAQMSSAGSLTPKHALFTSEH